MKTSVELARIPLDTTDGLDKAVKALCDHYATLPEPKRLVSTFVAGEDLICVFDLV